MSPSLRDLLEEPPPPAGLEWEEIDCPLCAGRRWTPLIEAPDTTPNAEGYWFLVVRCDGCGLCFTNPRPTPRCIGQFYRDDYGPHHKEVEADPRTRGWLRRCLTPLLPWNNRLRKTIPRHGLGRLLDFGCGGGTFLIRMQRQGWAVTGLDASLATVQRLRDQHGLNALAGTLPGVDLPDESFDLITMWQSLEHVHRPLEALQDAYRLLAPGGKVLVALHNIASLPFRWFGPSWFALDLPRHLTHFSPATLRLMLARAGFQVDDLKMVRNSAWSRASARLACRLQNKPSRWMRLLQGRVSSNLFSWYAYLTRQSDSMLAIGMKK